jgi:hypothetical protein
MAIWSPIQNSDCQADIRRFPGDYWSGKTAVRQLSRMHERALGRAHLPYFSNTFSICPTFFSTLPVFFSALPSACKLGLFVTWPAVSLTLAFHFVNGAFDLIFRTGVHLFSPCH